RRAVKRIGCMTTRQIRELRDHNPSEPEIAAMDMWRDADTDIDVLHQLMDIVDGPVKTDSNPNGDRDE
ncbi:MAG: hypothetical protein L0K48_07240, partial [Bifidobacterium mongoliense]|nr:hypothetical protein [Bifidobacterium mongoliense]